MDAGTLGVPGPRWWRFSPSGATGIAVAERDVLGTTARVAVWPPRLAGVALLAVDGEIERLDQSASRFRADSELSMAHERADVPVPVSSGLAEAIRVALAAARWTGGLVDPTVGAALIGLGYDRDFAAIAPDSEERFAEPSPAPGWQRVRLYGSLLGIPAGITLDLGATAKGLGADRAARAAHAACGTGGVLVSLGGDMAAAGTSPTAGWPVLIADDHRQESRDAPGASPTQQVRLRRGGLATSSIACRQWRRAGRELHHIVDPRTGLPASGPWRTVSVAAATCAEANAAATAAIISGDDAPQWLGAEGLPARLVGHDGSVVRAGPWPEAEDGPLEPPDARMLTARTPAALAAAGQRGRRSAP